MPLLRMLNMSAPQVHAFEHSFCYIVEPLEGGALLEEMSQAPLLVYSLLPDCRYNVATLVTLLSHVPTAVPSLPGQK